ncbi:hypothetical protein MMC31_002792 [Peltigera leucophlebia]|nr:hypothetical protein [Peltigera leucophlebia]
MVINNAIRIYGPVIECKDKPLGATAKDCPKYRLLLDEPRHWASSGTDGWGAGGDYQSPSTKPNCQRTGLPSWGSSGSGGKDTGNENRSFSAGLLSRLRKGLSSGASDESGVKDTGGDKDTGASSTATASSKEGA